MNEVESIEVEKVLLYVSDARERSVTAISALKKKRAGEHVIEALEQAERELAEAHKRLMQGTYFAVPDRQLSI